MVDVDERPAITGIHKWHPQKSPLQEHTLRLQKTRERFFHPQSRKAGQIVRTNICNTKLEEPAPK
jgi:hypothetical protein